MNPPRCALSLLCVEKLNDENANLVLYINQVEYTQVKLTSLTPINVAINLGRFFGTNTHRWQSNSTSLWKDNAKRTAGCCLSQIII